ncbi:HpcH/HpaI aldolase/citrate lyase family protein [Fictibacillus enclensis]|uniref:HpcH/HpaI aldolase/citrate lyase family protein n=1 Tax=Fictibacillus enclensis TaxID=1017270 RepID=UPI0024BF3345|nr:CoA ester lyase [Fictibacillus enclensis]WHY71466.1 CoA ester lyase [Fictibacillus enclensis]
MKNMNRSYLFVPPVSSEMIDKALKSEADHVIIDLEDAVALGEKEEAGKRTLQKLLDRTSNKAVCIRINDITTPFWRKDVEIAIEGNADSIIIPKAESGANIQVVCEYMEERLNRRKISYSPEVMPLVETARGVHEAYEIASSHRSVSRLLFGSVDFSLDVGCEPDGNGEELLFARSQIVIASRAAGIEAPVDTVFTDIKNEEGLRNETLRSKRLGFRGKLAIHPKQLPVIHQVFSPTQKEVEEAEAIVHAFEEAELRGLASLSLGGKMIDYPVYKKAKRLLTLSNQKGEYQRW